MKKAVMLISGGIDSPVAAFLMSKKYDLVYVYFDNHPFDMRKKLTKVKKLIKKIGGGKLYVIPEGCALKIFKKTNERMTCILCKRMMYRIANKVAKKEKAKFIITGESLAQVASQTLSNMKTLNSASDLPVLRPLIGFDKEEIISVAKNILTYETSIEKLGSCTAVPEYPATKSRIEEIESIEKSIKVDKLANEIFKKAKTIVLNN